MPETFVNLLQWLVFLSFFLLVVGAMFAEAFWLSKRGWTNFARGFVFSAVSNFIGFAVGLFVFFLVFVIFAMLSLDGSLKRLPDGLFIGMSVLAIFLTPTLLIICKRILLAMLKIQTGSAAWLYALVSSILIVVVSLGVPVLLGYFIFR